MNITNETTVREIALENPETTRVFEEFKIDYCCGGRRPLAEACSIAGANYEEVGRRLDELLDASMQRVDWIGDAGIPELIDHILEKHHVFTKKEIFNLAPLVEKVVRVHGDAHPELHEVKSIFGELSTELMTHMMREEEILFPFVLAMVRSRENGLPMPLPPFGTVQNPVRMMMAEHDHAGEMLQRISDLTGGYMAPPDACPSFSGLMFRLEHLQRDLHEHIHLENNVLFPRAVEMEKAAMAMPSN